MIPDGKFLSILNIVLGIEGGYSDNSHDSGGATNIGITRKTLARWRKIVPWQKLPKSEVKNLTRAEAKKIYQVKYWRPIKGNSLLPGLDLSVFDFAVNSGPSRAVKDLQALVRVKRDGQIGPKTLLAIDHITDIPKVINHYNDNRLSFLRALVKWKYFGKGWSRRVAIIRVNSITMWMAQAGVKKVSQQRILSNNALQYKDSADKLTLGGILILLAGLVSTLVFGHTDWLTLGLLVSVVIVVIGLVLVARTKKDQAAVFKAELKKLEK